MARYRITLIVTTAETDPSRVLDAVQDTLSDEADIFGLDDGELDCQAVQVGNAVSVTEMED